MSGGGTGGPVSEADSGAMSVDGGGNSNNGNPAKTLPILSRDVRGGCDASGADESTVRLLVLVVLHMRRRLRRPTDSRGYFFVGATEAGAALGAGVSPHPASIIVFHFHAPSRFTSRLMFFALSFSFPILVE
jgi:hypothetical protein